VPNKNLKIEESGFRFFETLRDIGSVLINCKLQIVNQKCFLLKDKFDCLKWARFLCVTLKLKQDIFYQIT